MKYLKVVFNVFRNAGIYMVFDMTLFGNTAPIESFGEDRSFINGASNTILNVLAISAFSFFFFNFFVGVAVGLSILYSSCLVIAIYKETI